MSQLHKPETKRIRVAVVEDSLPLLHALRAEIGLSPDLECVATFETSEDALKAMPRIRPDVVVMDLGLPRMDGFECTRQIKKYWPRTKVLVFSASDTNEAIITAFGAGVDGYLVKESTRHELEEAIRQAYHSQWPMSQRVRQTTAVYVQWRQRTIPRLSPREKLILELLEKGRSRKEIADLLKVSPETVKTHVDRILEKSRTASTREAAYVLKLSP